MKKIIITLLALGALAACNSGGSSPYSFNITSISPPTSPSIVTNTSFTATFNNNVNASTLNGNVTLYNRAAQQYVTITCTTPNASSATCTPAARLLTNTGYTLTFTSGVQSTTGVSLSTSAYSYTTGNQ